MDLEHPYGDAAPGGFPAALGEAVRESWGLFADHGDMRNTLNSNLFDVDEVSKIC